MTTLPPAPADWPRAAVFDCDGLLIDSAHCWARACAAIAREHGRSAAELDREVPVGASVPAAAAWIAAELGEPISARRLEDLLLESFALEPPPPMTGAMGLVAALSDRLPVGLASNSPQSVLDQVLGRLGIRHLFGAVVSAETVAADKPAPDVYLEACRRLDVCPSDAVAFEDSVLGAQAARSAGLVVLAVPSVRGTKIDADLTVPRLDDPRLHVYLGLDPLPPALSGEAGAASRPR